MGRNSLVEHWRRLHGPVHPDDMHVLANLPHSFNVDYPPPAFIGDIVNAPVVLLDANCAYDPTLTPSGFSNREAYVRFVQLLHEPCPVEPASIAPYYGKRNYRSLIASGRLAVVNAVPYRSRGISREPENRRIAERLPSTQVHRDWLRNELIPAAARGERLVVVHRTSLWKISRREDDLPNVVFTPNPRSPDLSRWVLERMSVVRTS
ncbi:hypothetical protein C8D95_105328 [Silicimonas algicola]|uniref:Uncharacterized protein n=2 Tax=Silicimonas algicola TaxID=1826607 RepID=A0A316G959_9RHOB|nr:hypothetical protein C8D95_105328 [Silicimonas algicola]